MLLDQQSKAWITQKNSTPRKIQSDLLENLPKPKTTKEIRDKYKLNLLKYFSDDSEKRRMETRLQSQNSQHKKETSTSIKSLKLKKNSEQKYYLQKQRYSNIMKEREDQMKLLDEKLSKSSRSVPDSHNSTSFSKWRERSRSRIEKIKEEEDKTMMLKFELYNKKLHQSAINHKTALENKSKKIMQHNAKVEMVKDHIFQSFKNNDDDLIFEYLNKHKSANSRREKNKNELENKILIKKKKILEKRIRVDLNRAEDDYAKSTKAEKLEKKHFKSVEVLKKNKVTWENKLEEKHEKDKMKFESSFERLQRKKKLEMKHKEDILKKHQKINDRLKIRKNSMEKTNEKFREIAVKEAIERDKAKSIKFRISKSKEPLNFKSVMSAYD